MSTCVLLKLWRVATDTRSGPLVILYYDYFLTIVPEYNLFWVDSRLSWTSFLFFLNRYSALVAHVPVLIQYFWNLPDHVSVSPYLYFQNGDSSKALGVSQSCSSTLFTISRTSWTRCQNLLWFSQFYCTVAIMVVTSMLYTPLFA